jgi:flagellar motor protein MotB
MHVLNYVLAEGTLQKDRFTAYGWAEYRPLITNKTKETRRMNRRMDIVFVHEKPPEEPRGIFTFKKFFFKVFD